MAPRGSHLRPAGSASGRRRCASDQPLEPLAIPLGAHHSRLQDIPGRNRLFTLATVCDVVEGAESATGRSLKALRSVPPVTHRAPPHLVVGPTAAIIHLRRAKLSSPLRQLSFLGDICARGALRDFSGPDRCRSPRRNPRVVARGTRMGSHREVWAARSHRLPPAALEGAGAFSAFVAAGLVRSLGLLVGIGRLLRYSSGLAKEISWPSGS